MYGSPQSHSPDRTDENQVAIHTNDSQDYDNVPPPAQRPRISDNLDSLIPYNTGNTQHIVPTAYKYASIHDLLEMESTIFTKIVGRLMCITQCKEVSGKTPGYTYSYKAKKEKKAIQGSFRLLLFQDLTGTGSVFYIKVPNPVNHYIWNKCLDVRDSGPCSIGSIFVFMGPKPITDVYCNDICVLTPSGGAI